MNTTVTLVGGPTAVLELAGLRIITDPTFDAPQVYQHPVAGDVVKTTGPAFSPEELGRIDIALVSHEHIDNLDMAGRDFLNTVPQVFTTTEVADQFGENVVGLAEYSSRQVPLPGGGEMTITAVPAKHGPEGVWQLLGPVIGFLLTGPGLPTIYVSGDNSQVEVVSDMVAKFGTVDIAVLFVGGAKFDAIADGSYITLSNERALECARILEAKRVISIHEDSWKHFSQNAREIRELFETSGLGDTIVALAPGESADVTVTVV